VRPLGDATVDATGLRLTLPPVSWAALRLA
jgi:hypothetical protein